MSWIRKVHAVPFERILAKSYCGPYRNLTGLSRPPLPSHMAPDGTNRNAAARPLARNATFDLVNTLAVFWICSYPTFVKYSMKVFDPTRTLHLTPIANFVIKHTFYKQFCAGETTKEVLTTMQKLETRSVGGILDMAIEADVASGKNKKKRDFIADSNSMVKEFMESVELAEKKKGSWIALKVTALIPPPLLQRFTNTFNAVHTEFANIVKTDGARIASEKGYKKMLLEDSLFASTITLDQFKGLVQKVNAGKRELSSTDLKTLESVFKASDKNNDGKISWVDIYSNVVTTSNLKSLGLFAVESSSAVSDSPGYPESRITKDDIDLLHDIMPGIMKLGQFIKEKKVRSLVDAEQAYLQRCVDDVAMILAEEINTPEVTKESGPLIFNTYQCYLKDISERIKVDILRTERAGAGLGFKTVRGAYMDEERPLSKVYKYEDPFFPNKAGTDTAYNKNVKEIIDLVWKATMDPQVEGGLEKPYALIAGTHNNKSINDAIKRIMEHRNSGEGSGQNMNSFNLINFGTLYGMRECMTDAVAKVPGVSIYKYLPYGGVGVVIPYLMRRAVENKEVISQIFSTTSEIDEGAIVPDYNDISEVKKELQYRLRNIFA